MTRFHPLRIADVRRESPDAVSIAFTVPEEVRQEFAFTPGQYLTLRTMLGGEEVRRTYSICSGMDEGELRVAVKRLEGGVFSRFANENLKAGDVVDVMPPMGRFGVVPGAAGARTYVGFAAGSGITPILSIIKTVLSREPESRFVLFYGNRSSASIIFKDALEDLKDRFVERLAVHHVLSREAQDIPLLSGRITGDKVEPLVRTVGEVEAIDDVFLCGPLGMIEEVKAALSRLGVPEARIHVEVFTPSGTLVPAPRPEPKSGAQAAPGAALTVRIDGLTHELTMRTDETILEAAVRHGLDLPYSCRGGMCCTCRAKVTEGAGVMDQNFSLEAWEQQAGFTLTCQCRPTTPRIAVDYDAV
jgi:ring-1,2-phenylacetyl-CoA epoxidase subunit PaaE